MQLDRTELVIRQRTTAELFDLTGMVLRRHFKPILIASALFGLPLMIANVIATSWMLSEESLLLAEQTEAAESLVRWRQMWHLIALTFLEFPIMSLPTTVLIGELIFLEPVTIRQTLGRLWNLKWRWLWVLGVIRMGLVGLVIESLIDAESVEGDPMEILLFGVAAAMMLVRAVRPFAPEILVLEQCPVRSQSPASITYRRRNRSLHTALTSGENILRFAAMTGALSLLCLSLTGNALFIQAMFTGSWSWNWGWDYVIFPLLLWVLGTYAAVFRFLAYIDNRIRSEGWEIELLLRAEAARQREAMAPVPTGLDSPKEVAV